MPPMVFVSRSVAPWAVQMKAWRATNSKINSKGQLRDFNCTIRGTQRASNRAEGRERQGKKEKRGQRQRSRALRGDGGKGERRERQGQRGAMGVVGVVQEMTDRAHTSIIIITLLDRDGSERRALAGQAPASIEILYLPKRK